MYNNSTLQPCNLFDQYSMLVEQCLSRQFENWNDILYAVTIDIQLLLTTPRNGIVVCENIGLLDIYEDINQAMIDISEIGFENIMFYGVLDDNVRKDLESLYKGL